MADNTKAWLAVHTKGSKQMRDRLSATQAKNPAYQEFVKKHGFGATVSKKQSETIKPKSVSPQSPVPDDGSKGRLAAIKSAADKLRLRKAAASNRAAFGGQLGGDYSVPLAGFRTYRESTENKPPFEGPYKKSSGTVTDKSGAKHTPMSRVKHLARLALNKKNNMKEKKEMNEAKTGKPRLTGAVNMASMFKKHVEKQSGGKKTIGFTKTGVLVIRNVKKKKMKEEVEQIDLIERLSKTDPPSSWIHDFVKSDNPKFAGKSKKERINMALGAYYSKQRQKNEEVVQEKLDPVGKETADIDNDKDVDKTDLYLHARRQKIGKAIAKKKGMS